MSIRVPGLWAAVVPCVFLAGCGYVGEPQNPALNIPNPVKDLAAVQRGDKILVEFTAPALTTEGLTIKSIDSVDLRAGTNPPAPFSPFTWAGAAKRIPMEAPEPASHARAEIPVHDLVGKDVLLGVRTLNDRGRASKWSNFFTVKVQPPLAMPTGLLAEASADGVNVRWRAPDSVEFRVYRKGATDKEPVLLGKSDKPEYLDKTAEYGKSYEYFVQGLRGDAETDVASAATGILKDVFPPAVPAGLTAAAGVDSIELAWERDTESDLDGYNVYRSAGGEFEKVAEKLESPSYSDHKIESGHHYRYAVSAIDHIGNESERCAPVEAIAP